MAKRITPVTTAMVEKVAHQMAKNTLAWNEPIPPYETRFPEKLESCLVVPFQKFDNKTLYRGLANQASILFYLMVKNHPFQNGNKRVAVTTLLVFLFLNDKWLTVDVKELYNFAVWVAQSPAELKKGTLVAIKEFIDKHLVDWKK